MSDDAEIEARVASALERLGATHEVIRIDPGFADTAAFCEKYAIQPAVKCWSTRWLPGGGGAALRATR